MDSIRSIWIVLQTDAVLFCHEGPQDGIAGEYIMPLSRFQRVLGRARQLGWACTLVCNRNGLPDEYARECGAEVVDIIVPAGSRLPPDDRTTVVYESDRLHTPYVAQKVRSRISFNLEEEQTGFQMLRNMVDNQARINALLAQATRTADEELELSRRQDKLRSDESFLEVLIDLQRIFGIS